MSHASVIFDLQYFPQISFFVNALSYDEISLETQEHFVKSSYRNRCAISGPNGKQLLSVPILGGKGIRKKMNEVLISNEFDWKKNHWNSLCAAYRRSAYFEYYEDDLAQVFFDDEPKLFYFNLKLLKHLLSLLKMDLSLKHSSTYRKDYAHDFRSYYFHENFQNEVYTQVFEDRNEFMPDLSILDLIFNLGPDARKYLENESAKNVDKLS